MIYHKCKTNKVASKLYISPYLRLLNTLVPQKIESRQFPVGDEPVSELWQKLLMSHPCYSQQVDVAKRAAG